MIVPFFDRVGGYEKQAFSLSLALMREGAHPFIITNLTKRLPQFEIKEGIEIYRLCPGFQENTLSKGYMYNSLVNLFLTESMEVDVIHCHSVTVFSASAIQFAREMKIPTLIKPATQRLDIAGLKPEQHNSHQVILDSLKYVNLFVCLNNEIKKEVLYKGISEDKIVLMANGVDSKRFSSVASFEEKEKIKKKLRLPEKNLITYTGRFEKRKRVSVLIEAWKEILDNHYQLVVVGDGEEKEKLKNLTTELGVEDIVTFTGEVDNVEDYLKATDIYVFPSELEGNPNVLLEAMSTGLPIITTSISGIEEFVTDGEEVILVPPNNVNVLVEKIKELIKNKNKRSSLAKKAEERILKDYSFDIIAKRYITLYNHLIEQELRQLQQNVQPFLQGYQRLMLSNNYLKQSKVTLISWKLRKYPTLVKLFLMGLRSLAKVYRLFKQLTKFHNDTSYI